MKNLCLLFVISFVVSCAPRLYYLGDEYPSTSKVDTYFSPEDIEVEFKVIGQLTGRNVELGSQDLNVIKEAMVEEAKKRGANGILFLYADSFDNEHNVKADLLLYER